MKEFCLIFCFALFIGQDSYSQEDVETGLPGDGFSLEGAISVFSTVKTPEDFENALNAPDNGINNLDLNQDGDTDYLVVEDLVDGDGHALVIRALINGEESQNVAVIAIEKSGEKTAVLQIFGDEDLYGSEKIAEPTDEKYFGGKGRPSVVENDAMVIVNVWFWPCVVTLWTPAYRPWISPYRWGFYPVWWKPYRVHPFAWHYQYCAPFRARCSRVTIVRVNHVHYRTHRKSSVYVREHYKSSTRKMEKSSGQRKTTSSDSEKTKKSAIGGRGNVEKSQVTKTSPTNRPEKSGSNGRTSPKTPSKQPNKGIKRK